MNYLIFAIFLTLRFLRLKVMIILLLNFIKLENKILNTDC
nr:MAG TPA: hypothetical protein [Caudoviricetes sp.]